LTVNGQTKIKSGVYSKDVIQSISEVYVDVNIPWITVPVYGYHIVIREMEEVLLDKPVVSGSLRDPHIREIISQIGEGATVEIDAIEADIPTTELKKIVLVSE
jgi:hypothetical protein